MKAVINSFKIKILKVKIQMYNALFDYNMFLHIGKNVSISKNVDIRLRKNCYLSIGDSCHIGEGSLLDLAEGAEIIMEDNVLLFKYVFIVARNNIKIGKNSQIAEFSSIRDFDHSFENINVPIIVQGFKSEPIIIDEDVWIGRGAAILKGVRIGQHSVIGSNAVVTKDIPPLAVAAGAPARVFRKLGN